MINARKPGVVPVLVTTVLLAVTPAYAKHHKKHAAEASTPGRFDYYVLSLSWSPQHCASADRQDDAQCGIRRYGFVLHGLWPQDERGYPESCATTMLSNSTVEKMLDIMPSPELVRHEWAKHGTCSGLSADAYFAAARGAFGAVKIPAAYESPRAAFQTSADDVERSFQGSNPNLRGDGMAVLCRGRFLQEVRICLDKDLQPRVCSHDVHDVCRGTVMVRPVR